MRNGSCCLLILFFFAGCKTDPPINTEEEPGLFKPDVSFPLKLKEKYVINPFSGDSIKPLINSAGKKIITGTPYTIIPYEEQVPGFVNPQKIKDDSKSSSLIETNVNHIEFEPEVVLAKPELLRSVKLTHEKDSVILPGAEYFIFSRQVLNAVIKKIPLHEPQPVKVQPMRYKDNAVLDIQYLDIEQGLSYSYINSLYQDSKGYIWIATDKGISKYDGNYLTTYTENEGLIGNIVEAIAGDNKGRLWISTNKGLCLFDGNNFFHITDKDGILSKSTEGILVDDGDNIWVSVGEMGVLNYKDEKFIFYSATNNFSVPVVRGVIADNKGFLWFNVPGAIVRFNGESYTRLSSGTSILDKIISVYDDQKGRQWFCSFANGFTKFDGRVLTHYTKKNGLSDNALIQWMFDNKGNIWISTRYEGLNKFDGKKFTLYNIEQGLSENKIRCTFQDLQGNVWVGTSGGGINKIKENGFTENIPLNKFNNSRVRPIIKDKTGQLWFGTEGSGLYSFDGKKLVKQIDRGVNSVQGFRSAIMDNENNLWFGKQDGTQIYKYENNRFLSYYKEKNSSSILSLFEGDHKNLWIGTSKSGVAVFNGSVLSNYDETNGFPSKRVFVSMQDKNKNLWFGTEGGGLVKFDGKLFTVFSEHQGLFSKSITSIVEDEKGNLWLGTLDAGLCRFDGKNFTYYGEKQGLAYKAIWSLKMDHQGQLWVGTDNGLSVLIPENKSKYRVFSFGLQDGLKSTDFNLNSVCIDDENRIWWGTGKALISRDLNLPVETFTPQSLHISHIEVNDQFLDFRNMIGSAKRKTGFNSITPFRSYPDDLSLPHLQNHLRFHFTALDWTAPHKIKYSFRLIGLDNIWSEPSATTNADFRGLPPGNYEFQVKAIGSSEQWTKTFSCHFSIRPAWWQTWWFKIITALIIIVVTFMVARVIYQSRLRRQQLIMEKQLAVQMERQRISSEMHDDIGAGLSGVRLLTELTKSKLKEGDADGEVEKIYQSVGELSAKMKEVIWSLNTENDSLASLTGYLQKQARAMMENFPAVFEMELPEILPDIKIEGDKRRDIHLLVKEALHNIIKHSGANHVYMNIACDDVLRIGIADNGKGLNEKIMEDTGNGMKNMRQRIRRLNGVMLIQNENGLKLTFEIPLK